MNNIIDEDETEFCIATTSDCLLCVIFSIRRTERTLLVFRSSADLNAFFVVLRCGDHSEQFFTLRTCLFHLEILRFL